MYADMGRHRGGAQGRALMGERERLMAAVEARLESITTEEDLSLDPPVN